MGGLFTDLPGGLLSSDFFISASSFEFDGAGSLCAPDELGGLGAPDELGGLGAPDELSGPDTDILFLPPYMGIPTLQFFNTFYS